MSMLRRVNGVEAVLVETAGRMRHRKDDHVIPSLVSMYQSEVRRNLSAQLHRVPMPALPFAAGGAARPQGIETPQRRDLEKTF